MSMVKTISVKDSNVATWEEAEELAKNRGESMSTFIARLVHNEVLKVKLDRSGSKHRGDTVETLISQAEYSLEQARDLLVRS